MEDKVLHSAVGLGAYLTAFLSIMISAFVWNLLAPVIPSISLTYFILGSVVWIFLAPLLLALGKELFDIIRGGSFDEKDLLATLNPMIVIRWYIDIVN